MILRVDGTGNNSTSHKYETYTAAMEECKKVINDNPRAEFVILETMFHVKTTIIPVQVIEIK